MLKKIISISILVFFFVQILNGQNKVHFYNDNLKKAVAIAKIEGKDVFVDTWASWCIPCKQQEKVFEDEAVAKYLNKNFINVRVNMDSEAGKTMNTEYEVVFLPTLLVLNNEGALKVKTENYLSSAELLNFVAYGKDKKAPIFKSRLNNTPFQIGGPDEVYVEKHVSKTKPLLKNESVSDIEPDTTRDSYVLNQNIDPSLSDDKSILFIDDESYSTNLADYYYNQTSLKLQNMDADYKRDFSDYLKTQNNWDTEKNIKFIYNYVYSVQSPEFEFMVQNIDRFNEIIGEVRVRESIRILVYNRLYQGYPRPTYEEALKLCRYVYTDEETLEKVNLYKFNRLYYDEKYKKFVRFGVKHFGNKNDDNILYSIAKVYLEKLDNPKKAMEWIDKALKLEINNHWYHHLKSESYFALKKMAQAHTSAVTAKNIADKNKEVYLEWNDLIHKINGVTIP